MKVEMFDQFGKKTGEMALPAVFSGKVNLPLMAQAVRVFLGNQRKARAKAKTRAEVERTKAKWYRQKHTGRARHGAKSAPIFVGGGVAHGPTGGENFALSLSKKMRRQALFSALSAKVRDGEVKVLVGVDKLTGKTSEAEKMIRGLVNDGGRVTLVLSKRGEKYERGLRNLESVKVVSMRQLCAYEVLNGGLLVLAKEAVEDFLGGRGEIEKVQTKTAKKETTEKEEKK